MYADYEAHERKTAGLEPLVEDPKMPWGTPTHEMNARTRLEFALQGLEGSRAAYLRARSNWYAGELSWSDLLQVRTRLLQCRIRAIEARKYSRAASECLATKLAAASEKD